MAFFIKNVTSPLSQIVLTDLSNFTIAANGTIFDLEAFLSINDIEASNTGPSGSLYNAVKNGDIALIADDGTTIAFQQVDADTIIINNQIIDYNAFSLVSATSPSTFVVSGTANIPEGYEVNVTGSVGATNDGTYTISSFTIDSPTVGQTTFVVDEVTVSTEATETGTLQNAGDINEDGDAQVGSTGSGAGSFLHGTTTKSDVDPDPHDNPVAALNFVWQQTIGATVWNIHHHQNRYPQVTVVDDFNNEVWGDVKYIDKNHVRITFSVSVSGKAYLT